MVCHGGVAGFSGRLRQQDGAHVYGLELLPGAIIDQHFLKRNRLSRLIAAIRTHPGLIGFGIDEGTAIVVCDNEYRIVGRSYVIRVELVDGAIKIDAFKDGDIVPLADR